MNLADSHKTPLELIAQVLRKYGVEYIVIGGQAEALMGSTRATFDVDVCHLHTDENIRRLGAALVEMGARYRGVPEGLPAAVDAATLRNGMNFTLTTVFGDLDLLAQVVPIGNFADLAKNAVTIIIDDGPLRVISLDDLIKVKRHVGRPKDLDSLANLLRIKECREHDRSA